MSLPEVDVLMPVRAARRTLPFALGDVLAQRRVAVRVLAVLDAAQTGKDDDGTAEWLQLAARRERRIEVLHGPSAGLAAALQLGLDAVRAPLLAHMEADDRSAPDRLARLHFELTQGSAAHPVAGRHPGALDAVVCRAAQFGARSPGMRRYLDWQNALLSHDAMARERFVEIPALHQTGLYRTQAVRDCGGYAPAQRRAAAGAPASPAPPAWPADIDFWMRWFEGGTPRRVVKLPRVLYRWRQHGGQQTRGGGSHSLASLRACKAHYLARHLSARKTGIDATAGGCHGARPFVFLSTGRTLTDWQAALARAGLRAEFSGQWTPGRPLPPIPQGALLVAAYGSPAVRERLRATLAAGLGRPAREPQELLFTA